MTGAHARSFSLAWFGDAGDTPVAELMAVAEERAARWLRERGFEPLWLYPIPGPDGVTVRAFYVKEATTVVRAIPTRPVGGKTRHWEHLVAANAAARAHRSLVAGVRVCPAEGCWHVGGDQGGMCRPCREAEKRRSASEGRAGAHPHKD